MTRGYCHSTGVLALVIGLLPVMAINLAYMVAVAADTVPACMPYLDGCTSISSTGRKPPSSYLFKPALLLTAVLLTLFWLRSSRWLHDLGERSTGFRHGIAVTGIVGAVALCAYVLYLGTEGPGYRLLRRYGVTVYFGFTYLAQLLLAGRLYRLALAGNDAVLQRVARLQLILCAVLLVIGLVSIPVTNFVANRGEIQNIIEWNLALLLQAWFLLVWRALPGANKDGDCNSVQ